MPSSSIQMAENSFREQLCSEKLAGQNTNIITRLPASRGWALAGGQDFERQQNDALNRIQRHLHFWVKGY